MNSLKLISFEKKKKKKKKTRRNLWALGNAYMYEIPFVSKALLA